MIDPKYKNLGIFSMIVWQPETGKTIRYLPQLDYPPKDVSIKSTDTFAVSPDGTLAGGVLGDSVLLYQTHSGLLIKKLTLPHPLDELVFTNAIAFSPQSNHFAVSDDNGRIHFFGADGTFLKTFTVYPATNEYHFTRPSSGGPIEATVRLSDYSCTSLTFNNNGSYIAGSQYKEHDVLSPSNISVNIWRVSGGTLLASLPGSTNTSDGPDESVPVRSLSWSPDGKVLAVGDDSGLSLWQVSETSQKLIFHRIISRGTFSVEFAYDGRLAATDNSDVVIYKIP